MRRKGRLGSSMPASGCMILYQVVEDNSLLSSRAPSADASLERRTKSMPVTSLTWSESSGVAAFVGKDFSQRRSGEHSFISDAEATRNCPSVSAATDPADFMTLIPTVLTTCFFLRSNRTSAEGGSGPANRPWFIATSRRSAERKLIEEYSDYSATRPLRKPNCVRSARNDGLSFEVPPAH